MDEPDSKVMTAKYYEVDEISVLLSIFLPLLSSLFDELLVLMAENKLN